MSTKPQASKLNLPARQAAGERKQRTRDAILEAASERLRRDGIVGASVATVMAGAGLTVGGFYAHFDNKDALIEAAFANTMEQMRGILFNDLPTEKDEAVLTVLRRYVSQQHRDMVDAGCPLPRSLGDLSAQSPSVQDAVVGEIETTVARLAGFLEGEPDARRNRALGLFALMVGSQVLARAFPGRPISDEFLLAGQKLGDAVLVPNRNKE